MGNSQVALILTVILSSTLCFGQNTAIATEAKKEVAAESSASAGGDVVIVTQQAAAPVVAQPTTVVTAAPLTSSRADDMRKQRERMEVENEQKIVEKLEQSRMEDEQKRLNNLFNTNQQQQQEHKVEAVPVVVAPVVTAPVQVAPVQTAPVKSEEELKSEIASQVRADLEDAKRAEEARKPKPRWYFGGVLSTLDYPDAVNVGSDFGAGVSVTWLNSERLGIEFSAVFSQATIDETYSLYKEVNQQNWSMASKYFFFDRAFTPVVGGIVSYTHREYQDMYQWGYNAVQGIGGDASTDALDVGLLIGMQFTANKNLSFGIDYLWLTNIETRYSDPRAFNRAIYQGRNDGYRPLEEIDYQFINMSMNFMF
jgi:hypothetical protein